MTIYYSLGPLLAIWYHAYISPDQNPPPITFLGGGGPRFVPPMYAPKKPYPGPPELHEEFVVGVGQRIEKGEWVELDEPYNFAPYNYIGFYEQTVKGFRGIDGPKIHRIFIWKIWLELTIPLPPPPKPITSRPANIPPPVPSSEAMPIELTSFDTFGRNIPYSAGARRLAGAKIWAVDLDQADDTATAATGSWAEAFGYPLFPDEVFYLNRLWGDGHLIYLDSGGPNAAEAEDVADEFDNVVIRIYYGTETQTPDPRIVSDKGANRTPAFRGLIYLVIENASLEIFGNRYPQLSAEFLREDGQRIFVADVLERVGELGGINVQCTNIDDMADGVVFESFNPRAIIQDYREQYNYRVIDGDPVRLVRREVNESLVVDWDLNPETDLVSIGPSDEVTTLERREDSELPNQVEITFIEKIFNYQSATQYARRPRFPVSATESRDVVSQRTDFIITAVEALTLAYDMLYQYWTRRFTSQFTVRPAFSEIQEGDVVRLPTPQGTYLFDVTHRSLEPNQDVAIEAECMLAESGVEVDADSGELGRRVRPPCYYPQLLQEGFQHDLILSDDGRLWWPGFCDGVSSYTFVFTDRIPTRIGHASMIETPRYQYLNSTYYWNISDSVEEGNYIYRWSGAYGQAGIIQRIDKTTNTAEVMNLPSMLASGEFPGSFAFVEFAEVFHAAIFNNKLYYLISGYSKRFHTGGIPGEYHNYVFPTRLIAVDLGLWQNGGTLAPDTIELVPAPPAPVEPNYNTYEHHSLGLCVASVYVLVAVRQVLGALGSGYTQEWHRIYRYNTSDGSVDYVEVDSNYLVGRAIGVGDTGYFLPYAGSNDYGQVHGAHVNALTLAIDYFDISEDPDIFGVPMNNRPWVTGEHLCFVTDNAIGFTVPGGEFAYNQPRIGRRLLADMSMAPSIDLAIHIDTSYQTVKQGVADDEWHYLVGQVRFGQLKGNGLLMKVSLDGTAAIAQPYAVWGATADTVDNDNFADAKALTVNVQDTFYNEFATKEAGEPNHGNPADPGGRSLWWSFTAPADDVYTFNQGGMWQSSLFNGSVYMGSLLTNLVEIGGVDMNMRWNNQYNAGFSYINVPEGTKVYIAIDGQTYQPLLAEPDPTPGPFGIATAAFGEGMLTIASTNSLANNNFVNAISITAGQTLPARNRFATKELYEPDHAGNAGGKSLWWHFTPVTNGIYSFDTDNSDFATLLAVYTANDPDNPTVDNLTEIGSDDDAGHPTQEDYAGWKVVCL